MVVSQKTQSCFDFFDYFVVYDPIRILNWLYYIFLVYHMSYFPQNFLVKDEKDEIVET